MSMLAICATVIGLALGPPAMSAHPATGADADQRMQAEARITGIGESKVSGRLTFNHAAPFIFIEGRVEGLSPGKHGLHIHSGNSCTERGGHYDPSGNPHGSPDQPHDMRHVGDLGNLVAATSGIAQYSRVDELARLHGPHSIVGRVVVVHAGEDDYVSQPAGDSGKQIGCGVIKRITP